MVKKLLIMGGTAEAADLARQAVSSLDEQVVVISSLAGRLQHQQDIPGQLRIGGFGGSQGLADYITNEGIDFVVDATHPFAATISSNVFDACQRTSIPRLMLVRPPWQVSPQSKWLDVDDLNAAAGMLADISRRAFLSVGASGLEAFSKVDDVWFLVRLMEEPPQPLMLKNYKLIISRPPHTLESERALIDSYNIDTLITKQSGGVAGEAKIIAANEANISVIAIKRPAPEPGDRVETVQQALVWVANQP